MPVSNLISMTVSDLPEKTRRRVRSSVKESSLSHVSRDKEQLLLCPWEEPNVGHLRDTIADLRADEPDLNAYDFAALDYYRNTIASDLAEQEIITRTTRCSNAVLVISDGHTDTPPCQQAQYVFDALIEEESIPSPVKERFYLILISDDPIADIKSRYRPSGVGNSITVPADSVVERIRAEYGRLKHNSSFGGTPGDYWYDD